MTREQELTQFIQDFLMPITAIGFDCYGCKYDEWDDCREGCQLVERAEALGIEVPKDEDVW